MDLKKHYKKSVIQWPSQLAGHLKMEVKKMMEMVYLLKMMEMGSYIYATMKNKIQLCVKKPWHKGI